MSPTQTVSHADDIAQDWLSKSQNADNVAQMVSSQGRPNTLRSQIAQGAASAVKSFNIPTVNQKASQLDVARRLQQELFPTMKKPLFMKKK